MTRKANVNETLGRYGLPKVGGLWEDRYRSELRNTAPAALVRYLNGDNQIVFRNGILEWAHKEGFGDLWDLQPEFGANKPKPDLNLAFQMFINPSGRYVLGQLLFSTANDEEIISAVEDKLRVTLTPASIATYQRLFWDKSLLKRSEWPEFIKQLKTRGERHHIAQGLSSPSPGEARHNMGLNDEELSPDEILRRVATKAYRMFAEAADSANPEMQSARQWADLAVKASTALRTKGRFGQEDEKNRIEANDFEDMFSVEITQSNHITLAELQGQFAGRPTGSEA